MTYKLIDGEKVLQPTNHDWRTYIHPTFRRLHEWCEKRARQRLIKRGLILNKVCPQCGHFADHEACNGRIE